MVIFASDTCPQLADTDIPKQRGNGAGPKTHFSRFTDERVLTCFDVPKLGGHPQSTRSLAQLTIGEEIDRKAGAG